MIMGPIGSSVKACHLFSILFVVCFGLFSIPFWNDNVVVTANIDDTHENGKLNGKEHAGALTVVESMDNTDDDDDGVVTVEGNDEEVIEDDIPSTEMFEATSEWKAVKKGQKIPSGLHVRLNLQTGEKEAKLMADDKKQTNKHTNEWFAGEDIGTINTEKQRYSREEIKKALKDFRFDDSSPASDQIKQKPEAKQGKKDFRSYEELKDMMKKMQMSVKTEAEIVTQLVRQLKEPSTNSKNMNLLLYDIEYYLHQLDNARLFCDLEGMKVIVKLINHTEEEIRTNSLLVLGSALQSNAKVKVNAIENGIMQQLLRVISLDTSSQVKRKALFALSTLLRQFPYAQINFLEGGGMSAINDLFTKSRDESLKIKIVTLLTDLVHENDLNSTPVNVSDDVQVEQARQYSKVKIRAAVEKSGWCSHIPSLLHHNSGHDDVEKVLAAMNILKDTCKAQFSSIRPTLQSLSSHYNSLAKEEKEQGETDSFFDSIYSNIEELLKDLKFQREDL